MSRETFVEKQRRLAGEVPVPKRGRPSMNLSEEEKRERHKASSIKSKAKLKLINLAIDEPLLGLFKEEKARRSKQYGFELSHKQFLKVLLRDHGDRKGLPKA